MCTSMIRVRGRMCPCGKCNECCRTRANGAMQVLYDCGTRLGNCTFFTLTYDPDKLPFTVREKLDPDKDIPQFEHKYQYDLFYSNRQAHHVAGRFLAKLRTLWKDKSDIDDSDISEEMVYDPDLCRYVPDCPTVTYYHKLYEFHPSLCREDVKKWMKRGRKALAKKYGCYEKIPVFKYMVVGEYGPKTERPHYHGLIFGLPREDAAILMDDWKRNNGFVKFDFITDGDGIAKASQYCGKYINKGVFEPMCVKTHNCEKPRQMVSTGMIQLSNREIAYYTGADLGVGQFDTYYDPDDLERIQNRLKRTVNNVQYKLSNKYRQKYFKYEVKEIDFWTGEEKTRRINTPLFDALAAFTQYRLNCLLYGQLDEIESLETPEDRFDALRAFWYNKTETLESRRRLAARKQKDALRKGVF